MASNERAYKRERISSTQTVSLLCRDWEERDTALKPCSKRSLGVQDESQANLRLGNAGSLKPRMQCSVLNSTQTNGSEVRLALHLSATRDWNESEMQLESTLLQVGLKATARCEWKMRALRRGPNKATEASLNPD